MSCITFITFRFRLHDIYDVFDKRDTSMELEPDFKEYFTSKTSDSFEKFYFQKTVEREDQSLQVFYLRLDEVFQFFSDVNENTKTQEPIHRSLGRFRLVFI